MVQLAFATGSAQAYRQGQTMGTGQRIAALAVVAGLHVAVIGGFVIAQLHKPAPPPEKVLEVSFISPEQAAAAPPAPPQPVVEPKPTPPVPQQAVKTPQPTLMSTPAPTASTMSAPPVVERAVAAEAPAQVAQPAPPAAPAPSAAPSQTPAPVTPPSFNAAYLNNPGPVYPPSARRKHEEGTVRLRVQVSPEGAPLQVLVERTSGTAELDAAAVDVVKRRWKFAPAKQAGAAVAAWVIVPLEFSLSR